MDYHRKTDAERSAVARVPNAVHLDTESWFCASERCPAFVSDHVLKTDAGHLTKVAAVAVAPLLAASFDQQARLVERNGMRGRPESASPIPIPDLDARVVNVQE